ncbi:Retrovirus-related Pol polyprotein LINE-1 [Gossypium australe]|uniref:Retrovirus-related Pol polyprotein LINE-1 n=1 Tax=Gossypium australe TaxID=47621 RepID=A0A5B6X2Q1_9ROSI|nr:Retrovirus-related Pol polyprotein LINE-1 [Gossypium australe]
MGRTLTGEEVRMTLFEMAPLKSPRVDGLHAQFYQTQWNIVGESLVDTPEVISQYRPISLCPISYKVLTKHLTRQDLWGGRNTVDNVIILQEVIHSMSTRKGRKDGWRLK